MGTETRDLGVISTPEPQVSSLTCLLCALVGGGDPVGGLSVGGVLEGGGGDPPVQRLQAVLSGRVVQDLHLLCHQSLQLYLKVGKRAREW